MNKNNVKIGKKEVNMILIGVILIVCGMLFLTYNKIKLYNDIENNAESNLAVRNNDNDEVENSTNSLESNLNDSDNELDIDDDIDSFETSVNENNEINTSIDNDIYFVPTLESTITENSAWCSSMNIAWDEFKEKYVDDSLQFLPGSNEINNLNRGLNSKDYLSSENYYVNSGNINSKLINKVKSDVKRKFNLNVNLDNMSENYSKNNFLIYSMLYKEFKFKHPFTKLEDSYFSADNGLEYDNVKYFGIEDKTNSNIKKQVDVLYYNDRNNYAIALETTGKDQVILVKGIKGDSFKDVYNTMADFTKNYDGSKKIEDDDEVMIPYMDFKKTQEFYDIEGQNFLGKDKKQYEIFKVLQNIDFKLDERGGRVISDVHLLMTFSAEIESGRYFDFDSDFDLFLKENDKDVPYFALRISDPTLIQSDAIIVK